MMYDLEPLIRDRLAPLPSLKGVYGLPELAHLASGDLASKPTPCAYVLMDHYRVLEQTHGGHVTRIQTTWQVVVAVRHYTQTPDGAPARSSVSPILTEVLDALTGWEPPVSSGSSSALRLVDAPPPEFHTGILLFPLAFTSEQLHSSPATV